MDENSYYSNYYDRDEYRSKKIKKQLISNFESSIKIDIRWSKDKIAYSKEPQIIYASISRGLKPILNATVKAYVYRPSGDYIEIRKFKFIFSHNIKHHFCPTNILG